MGKKTFIGVSSKAHKVKRIYLGVGNKAHKVKKGYIGVNSRAHQFFSSGGEPGSYFCKLEEGSNSNYKLIHVDSNSLTEISRSGSYGDLNGPFTGYASELMCFRWKNWSEGITDAVCVDTDSKAVIRYSPEFNRNFGALLFSCLKDTVAFGYTINNYELRDPSSFAQKSMIAFSKAMTGYSSVNSADCQTRNAADGVNNLLYVLPTDYAPTSTISSQPRWVTDALTGAFVRQETHVMYQGAWYSGNSYVARFNGGTGSNNVYITGYKYATSSSTRVATAQYTGYGSSGYAYRNGGGCITIPNP